MLPSPADHRDDQPLMSGAVSSGESGPTEEPISAPAKPPSIPVRIKVSPLTWSSRTPHNWAAIGCCETARVAIPS